MQNLENAWANVNGIILPAGDAKISIFDRGFLYGDSIYEVSYAKNGQVLFLPEHLDRLENSASLLQMNIDLDRETIESEIYKTVNKLSDSLIYIRIIITRGESDLSLAPQNDLKNNMIIIANPLSPPPAKLYEQGMKLMTSSFLRTSSKSVDPNAKSGNYLNNILAVSEAKRMGFDDAIMLNHDMQITEGTTFNIFIVQNNTLYTPSLKSGLLKGITRQKIIEICKKHQINMLEQRLFMKDLEKAEEVFITSSTRGVMPVSQIDQNTYPNSILTNSLTRNIHKLYLDLINK